jgi:GTP-binding protein
MAEDYGTVDGELRSYSATLAGRPRLVVGSKADLLPEAERTRLLDDLSSLLGRPVLPLSAVTGLGVRELIAKVSRLLTDVDA